MKNCFLNKTHLNNTKQVSTPCHTVYPTDNELTVITIVHRNNGIQFPQNIVVLLQKHISVLHAYHE